MPPPWEQRLLSTLYTVLRLAPGIYVHSKHTCWINEFSLLAKYTEPNSIVLPLRIMQDGQNMKTVFGDIWKLTREQASAKPDPKRKKAQRSPVLELFFPSRQMATGKETAERLRI